MAPHLPVLTRLQRERRGAALIEFALVLPLLLYLLFGILCYGQYFLIAHSLQEIANDAARATVAGLTADERRTLAQQTVADEAGALPTMVAGPISTATTETTSTVTVSLSIDAGAAPLLRMPIVPLPSSVIRRRATIRPGGFA